MAGGRAVSQRTLLISLRHVGHGCSERAVPGIFGECGPRGDLAANHPGVCKQTRPLEIDNSGLNRLSAGKERE